MSCAGISGSPHYCRFVTFFFSCSAWSFQIYLFFFTLSPLLGWAGWFREQATGNKKAFQQEGWLSRLTGGIDVIASKWGQSVIGLGDKVGKSRWTVDETAYVLGGWEGKCVVRQIAACTGLKVGWTVCVGEHGVRWSLNFAENGRGKKTASVWAGVAAMPGASAVVRRHAGLWRGM